jgi:hypothetical protein
MQLNWNKTFVGGTMGLLLLLASAAGQALRTVEMLPPNDRPSQSKAAPVAAQDEDANPQKIFGVISNIKTVNDPNAAFHPLTSKEKFKLVRGYFSVGTLLGSAFGAGLSQATDGTPDYGQGAKGYGKRLGAGLGDGFTEEVFVTGVFPSLFHEDPRYFRQGRGGFTSRTWHAASRVLVTKNDAGRRTFNFSEFCGTVSSSAISNAYYPREERGWADVMERAGSKIGGNAVGFVVREFAPDILRKLKRKKPKIDAPASATIPAQPR